MSDPVSVGVIAATTLASMYMGHESAKRTKEAADTQTAAINDAQKKKEKQFKDKQLQDQMDANRDSQASRLKAMQMARGAYGRSDTVLTGPLGLSGGGDSTSKKTLLGM
jgi:hypothetical protein